MDIAKLVNDDIMVKSPLYKEKYKEVKKPLHTLQGKFNAAKFQIWID